MYAPLVVEAISAREKLVILNVYSSNVSLSTTYPTSLSLKFFKVIVSTSTYELSITPRGMYDV